MPEPKATEGERVLKKDIEVECSALSFRHAFACHLPPQGGLEYYASETVFHKSNLKAPSGRELAPKATEGERVNYKTIVGSDSIVTPHPPLTVL